MKSIQLKKRVPVAFAALLALLSAFIPYAATAASTVYTSVSDFNNGVLSNVVNVAPGQIQLSGSATPQPFMWIANAGEDTVSKINTSTNTEVARYRVGFGPAGSDPRPYWTSAPSLSYHDAWTGPAPSRTAVDAQGNVYVANRQFNGRSSVVIKILATGGIDRNGNGVIDTSTGPTDIKALLDGDGDGFQDINEFSDERVAWSVQVGGVGGIARSLSIDPSGDIWVGLYEHQVYYKLRASDGAVLAGPVAVGLGVGLGYSDWVYRDGWWNYEEVRAYHRPYGSLVDASGILWSADLGRPFLKLNTSTYATQAFLHEGNTYGIALGNTGKVYLALRDYGANSVAVFNPGTNSFSYINVPGSSGTLGISTDSNGDIFMSAATSTAGGGYALGITKLRGPIPPSTSPDGSIIWSKPAQSGANGGDQRGAIVDSNGDVWTVNRPNNNVSKFRGTDGAALAVVPVGNNPYTYSDATGSAFLQSNPSGTWSVVHDTGCTGSANAVITWVATVPPSGASLTVEVRAANTVAGLSSQSFVAVSNGGTTPPGVVGRFLEVRVSLTGTLSQTLTTPVLDQLSITTPADTTAPVISCPANIVVNTLPGSCSATATYAATASDNCVGAVGISYSIPSGSSFPKGVTPVTVTAVDAAGNTSACTFTVTVEDKEKPVIAPVANITVTTAPGRCDAPAGYATTATDNCGAVTISYSPAPGSVFPKGTTPVTATATDASGNSASTTFTVTVVDNEKPVIGTVANITVNTAPGRCDAPVSFATTASDNCGAVTISYSPAPGSVFPKGTTPVTATATDSAGNSATTSFTVTVLDNEAPAIAGIANITVTTAPGRCDAPVNFATTATDNCPGVAISYSAAPGSIFPKGTTLVTATAIDAAGNTASTTFTVTVEDKEAPVVAGLANITVNTAPGACDAKVNFETTATDNCPGVTISYSPASGSVFPKGTTPVTATATDASGNTASTTFTVTVLDKEAPVVAGIANITVNTTLGRCDAPASFSTTATDNCGPVNVTYSHAPGSVFPKGVTTVTATATDASGNTGSTQFTVTVTDNERPVIGGIANIALSTVPGTCGAPANFATLATDNCGVVNVTYSHAPGSVFPKGVTTVTATATDASGNTASTSFTVTVSDNEKPVIASLANIIANTVPGACDARVSYETTATDNCPGVTISYSPASGSVFPLGTTTVTATATDASGNTASTTFTVTVQDKEAPKVVCPANITVGNDAGKCSAVVNYPAATATDNCSGAIAISYSVASGTVFPKGTTPVTVTATDAAGNSSTCTFTVTVNDTEAPVGTCVPTTNPSGNNVPAAGKNPKSGQNPDGFYQLLGKDNCDAPSTLALYVKDTGSSYVAGPFKDGDKVKITQAPGVTPNTKPMAGVVIAHIQLKGDALLIVKDAAGNTSVAATCLVAPAPK